MIALWIAAFLVLAAAAALIVFFSLRPVAVVSDPAQTVYLRQLAEMDELADRGLISPEEHALAKAEAARRALKEQATAAEKPASNASRLAVVASVAGVGILALGTYLAIGAPGFPDQPYARRLASWQEGISLDNIGRLSPQQLAAILKERAKEHPNDPDLLRLLASMQEQSGDDLSAIRTLEKALSVQPNNAEAWSMLGQLHARIAEGEVNAKSRAALEKARALDPSAVAPRYLIGKAEIEAGRREEGLALWRSLRAELTGEQQAVLSRQIAEVEGGGGPVPQSMTNVDPAILAMVERLSARLKENPDDAAGWARLVRSYTVLGDQAKLDATLAEARRRFAGQPDDLKAIEAAVEAPQ